MINESIFTKEQIDQAKQNGIPYLTLYKRVVDYGWEVEEAISKPTGNRFGNPKSKIPDSYKERAFQNGISYVTLTHRYLYLGWDLEKATSVPPRKLNERIPLPDFFTREWYEEQKYDGKTNREIAEELYISRGTMEQWIRELGYRGGDWTHLNGRRYKVDPKRVKRLSEEGVKPVVIAKALKVTPATVYSILKKYREGLLS